MRVEKPRAFLQCGWLQEIVAIELKHPFRSGFAESSVARGGETEDCEDDL
jgi:hypothetical protein